MLYVLGDFYSLINVPFFVSSVGVDDFGMSDDDMI